MNTGPHRRSPPSPIRATPSPVRVESPNQTDTSRERAAWIEDQQRSAGVDVFSLPRPNDEDRKRPHGSEHDRRPYPYSDYHRSSDIRTIIDPSLSHSDLRMAGRIPSDVGMHLSSTGTGGVLSYDSTQAQRPGAGQEIEEPGRMQGMRRIDDMTIPTWQPDNEVSKCPVCSVDFTMFRRKHHCRTCGQVICASCSPHRITVPTAFVVQPPNALYPTGLDHGTPERDYSSGGEIVRVCKPCVPDPWLPGTVPTASNPTPTETTNLSPLAGSQRTPGPDSVVPPVHQTTRRYTSGLTPTLPYPPVQPPLQGTRQRSQSHLPGPSPVPSRVHRAASDAFGSSRWQQDPASSSSPSTRRRSQHNVDVPPHRRMNDPNAQDHNRTMYDLAGGTAFGGLAYGGTNVAVGGSPRQTVRDGIEPWHLDATSPRRIIKEEDECPVCGKEMPAAEAFREQHIQQCIALRFSSGATPPTPATDVSAPSSASGVPPGGRQRLASFRSRGMTVSVATEKDCANAEGEAFECVICLEEFQPGDELGRMECLCKFHRLCIRRWWEQKGGGSCPTHALQE